MDWNEIKKETDKIYPDRLPRNYQLNGKNRRLAWTNAAYAFYPYQKYVKHCVEIKIELKEEDQRILDFDEIEMHLVLAKQGGMKMAFEDIEQYFFEALKGVCIPLVLAIYTNEKGFDMDVYVDYPDKAVDELNQLKSDQEFLFNFDFKISEDENWDIIGMMLY